MHFISINLSLNPTDEELRKAREICALMRSMSDGTDPNRGNGDEDTVPVKSLTPPPPPGGAGSDATFQPNAQYDADRKAAQEAHEATVPPHRDVTGLPWDARIHSSTKGINQDGSWKKRRGVQDAEVTKIEAEIRATLGSDRDPVPAIPTPATLQTQVPAPGPVPPPPTVAPPAPPVAGVNPFVTLLQKVAGAMVTKQLTREDTVVLCQALGLAGLPLLAQRMDLIPTVEMYVDARVAGQTHADALAMVKAVAGV